MPIELHSILEILLQTGINMRFICTKDTFIKGSKIGFKEGVKYTGLDSGFADLMLIENLSMAVSPYESRSYLRSIEKDTGSLIIWKKGVL